MADIFEIGNAPGSVASTQVLGEDLVLRGNVSAVNDADFYRVNLVAGETYLAAVVGTGTNALFDPILRLRNTSGDLLNEADDGLPNTNSLMSFTVATSGTYFLDVRAFDPAVTGQYGLSFTSQSKAVFDGDMGAGVINSGYSWAAGQGSPATVSFGFRATAATYSEPNSNIGSFTPLTAIEQTAVRQILGHFSEICGLSFTDVNPAGLTNNATLLFGNYLDRQDGSGAFAYLPGDTGATIRDGDVWLNTDSVSTTVIAPGDYSFATIIHEIGHAVGLSHPGEYNAAPNVTITYGAHAQFAEDTEQYTVMSYFAASNTGAVVPGSPVSLLLADIEALQNIYGANMATRNTDTVYGFNATAGGLYDFATAGISALCIWDGGGIDTLDLSGFSDAQLIDIRGGGFSDAGGFFGNLSIAYRAEIENAVGGTGFDTLVGNQLANHLFGGEGGDNLLGNAGTDNLDGELGNDILNGGAGADVLNGGDGIDAADYSLSTGTNVSVSLLDGTATGGEAEGDSFISIEDLIGSYTQRDILIGNDAVNKIWGNGGNDSLRGEGGDDILTGGAGADTLNGGAGTGDWASYFQNATTQVRVDLLLNTATGGEAEGDTFFFIENLEGSANIRDILIGNNLGNRIVGHGGLDTIRGEGGNDTIDGGAAGDSLNAGAGIDTVTYENSLAGVTVNLEITRQTSAGDASGDSLYFFENVTGSVHADTIRGNYSANRLLGGDGSDTLDGGTGSDYLTGGADGDTFRFQDSAFGTDRILDWEDGTDHISIALSLESSFAGLDITGNGTSSVTVRGFSSVGTIVVQSSTAFTLDASDFVFV